MDYEIKSIESKSKYYRNRYYPLIVGRECNIVRLEIGWGGLLFIDVPYDPGNPHRFCTTPVLNVQNRDDGTVVFETENSVYTLILSKKKKEATNERVSQD